MRPKFAPPLTFVFGPAKRTWFSESNAPARNWSGESRMGAQKLRARNLPVRDHAADFRLAEEGIVDEHVQLGAEAQVIR